MRADDTRFGTEIRVRAEQKKTQCAQDKQHQFLRREGEKNKKLASILSTESSTLQLKSNLLQKINSSKNKANQLKRFSSDRRKEKKTFDVLQTKNH